MLALKKIRKEQEISQQKLADKIGVSRSTIAMWETGASQPDNGMLKRMADFFNVSTDYLLGREFQETNYDWMRANGEYPYNPQVRKIPILGYVAAGLPMFAEEQIVDYTYMETKNDGYDYFALKVKGDSMDAAKISDGDLVIVRVQSYVENGEIAVVRVDNENATIKKYSRVGNIVQLMPQSFNQNHKVQIYDIEKTRVEVIGKVVECKIQF